MKHIYLIGMMGCGKSTCAVEVAKATGRQAVDTDEMIVKRAGMPIAEIFEVHGEERFRDMETEVCRELADSVEGKVVATGGGLPLREENRALLRESGVVVFLHRNPGETYDGMDPAGRPLGQKGREDFLARFAARLPLYRACAHVEITEFSSVEKTVKEILKQLEGII